MSENELMNKKKEKQEEEEEYESVLDAFEANPVNELLREEKLRDFYASLEFPCCGDYLEPKLTSIADHKAKKGKDFVANEGQMQMGKLSPYDGIFEHGEVQTETVSNELIRQKTRFIRDGREEYFQENGEFISEKQFFHTHLSRLANISFEENYAIRTFQKNAILSQRNNQKKSQPFELEINFGCLWFTNHELQNDEERRFEELRPLLKNYSLISSYPTLSQLSKEIEHLKKIRERMIEHDATETEKQEVENKINIAQTFYHREVDKIKGVMLEVLNKWKQIKEVRRNSGMETVPWKLNVKEYEIEGVRSFDIGVTAMELIPLGDQSGAEGVRRENIRKQKYFVKIFINGYEVAKSEKVHLQWPSFKVPINQRFNVTVYSAPSSIQVEIIKAGIINQTVDTVSLTLPGINSKTITASQQRYAGAMFSINGGKFRKGEEEMQAPAGMAIYRIEWKGQGSRMPPVSFKSQQEETAATEETEQQVSYEELFDMKDPRIPHRGRREEMDGDQGKGFGALLPFADIQAARHLLLKMKASQPELVTMQIPLLEEQIRKREDLLSIIESEKIKSLEQATVEQEEIYNPSEGFFKSQDEQILQEIRELLFKVQNVKINAVGGANRSKYKITEEIINEFIFEQMQSPLVICIKNCCTQKRKLGPKIVYYQQARAVFDEMEVNLHLRSARNMPIRESSFAQIRNFQEEENRINQNRLMHMGAHTGNAEMYGNYGMGFYQKPPNMNIQGQNMFIPGMNMAAQNRPPMEANYQRKTLERNNTYIQMRFKKMLKRTECFEGPFPEWNQTIEFNYVFENEQMTLEKMLANNQRMMKVMIFDMTEESKPTTTISEARVKKTKYFLGRVDIPMSLLVAIPSMTGIFRIQRPLLLFGYGIKRAGLFDFEHDLEEANRTEFPDIHTFLNFDLFSDPLIDSMAAYNNDRKYIRCAEESTLLLQRASDWLSELNTKRYIRMWLNNLEGKSIFICRWLSYDISPPPELGNQNLVERCARFVAMIPKKFTCKLMENTEEFHFTCDQFLNIKMGEDHGILLCNYFNYIDRRAGRDYIQSYLAIGKAFPYGKSIYVLRRNIRTNDCEIWDPYEGQCCFIPAKEYENFCCFFRFSKKKDSENQRDMCSMIELGCLVSPSNIYINIQQHMKPSELDFDLESDKLWKPFLNERMLGQYFDRGVIRTVQPEIEDGFYPKIKGIESQLENRLFDYLRGNLQSERRRHFRPYTFKINTNISNAIRNKLLFECETFKMDYRLSGSDSTLYSEHFPEQRNKYPKALDELEQEKNRIKGEIDADKLFYGFTINVPFTSERDIWERVQDAQVHLDQTENIEFVLAIKCFELSSHVVSVWVFIGSIA